MRRALLAVCVVASAIGVVSTADATTDPRVTHQVVRSFDGTPVYSTLFVPRGASATTRVPAVLRGPGWGRPGETAYAGTVKALVEAGYAVLTWDPRGVGRTPGPASVDALDVEARDVVALVDWLARQPVIATQWPDDPVVGMSGPSYGGAIQLATAAVDRRIDAIAPEIAWFDLRYSLFPNGVAKRGRWADLLFATGFADRHASPEWLLARSIAGYGDAHPVTAPALVMQGIDDELFDLNEGARLADYFERRGVPHRFIAFCGGHGTCRHPGDDRAHLDHAIVSWFDRWLRGDTDADTTPRYEYRTNEPTWRGAASFPPPDTRMTPAAGAGRVAPKLTVPAFTALAGAADVVGLPHASIDVHGDALGATLFIELVDREAGEVLSNQELPVRVTSSHLEVELTGVAHTLAPGHHLDLVVRADRAMTLSIVVSVPMRPARAAA